MKKIFADACYWIALLNRNDELHKIAVDVSQGLGNCRIVTSEMVLTEVLNGFSKRGQFLKKKALEMIEQIQKDPNVEVIPQTSQLFNQAVERYKNRPDKEWSLTDCASMLIMAKEGLTSALTHDDHFVQAGYEAMLRVG